MSELYTAELMASLHTTSAASAAAATLAAAAASGAAGAGDEERELTLEGGLAASTAAAGDKAVGAGGDKAYTFDAWAIDVDERVEAQLFFDPGRGNVVFASAVDGWACTVDDFAALHYAKLELPRALLRRAMWGEYYYKPKVSREEEGGKAVIATVTDTRPHTHSTPRRGQTKRIVTGSAAVAAANKHKPLAVSLFLERLWAVYEAAGALAAGGGAPGDEARLAKILTVLGVEPNKRGTHMKCTRLAHPGHVAAYLPATSPPPPPPSQTWPARMLRRGCKRSCGRGCLCTLRCLAWWCGSCHRPWRRRPSGWTSCGRPIPSQPRAVQTAALRLAAAPRHPVLRLAAAAHSIAPPAHPHRPPWLRSPRAALLTLQDPHLACRRPQQRRCLRRHRRLPPP